MQSICAAARAGALEGLLPAVHLGGNKLPSWMEFLIPESLDLYVPRVLDMSPFLLLWFLSFFKFIACSFFFSHSETTYLLKDLLSQAVCIFSVSFLLKDLCLNCLFLETVGSLMFVPAMVYPGFLVSHWHLNLSLLVHHLSEGELRMCTASGRGISVCVGPTMRKQSLSWRTKCDLSFICSLPSLSEHAVCS